MISYKDYIKLMEGRGYTHNGSVMIDESNPIIKTFSIKKKSIGKILELSCPENTIISACGRTHPGGCEKSYSCEIKCLDKDNKEPFQNLHYASQLTPTLHVIAEIIVTRIMPKEPDKNDPKVQEWAERVGSMLKIVGSENPCEYPIWSGAYNYFSKEFLYQSFNLYSNEKMIFYAINPDVDIVNTKLEMKADMLRLTNQT